ncbi:MAG: general secretion pathway protein GspB [Xanthomonadaceae bacterium]|nr:general secretion pathway protein GspB [Xanthomonadaceae bacterium]
MSLILEALRKSEAQRRLGQAPDLMAQMPAHGHPARRAFPAWPWFAAGLVLVAMTAWWLGRQHGPDASAPTAANDRSAQVDAAVQGPVPPTAVRPSPTDTSRAPSTAASAPSELLPDAPVASPSVVQPTPRPAPVAESAPAVQPGPPPAAPVVEGPASAEELERLRARLEAISQRDAPGPAVGERATDGVARAEPAQPESPAVVPAPAEPAVPVQAPTTELPRFAELSVAERADTPDLSFSLHVFGEDPQSRFVVFRGQRLGEGAQISPRLKLVEILRDGAVVEIDGRPVLVSRP